jgi:hypothetical protein
MQNACAEKSSCGAGTGRRTCHAQLQPLQQLLDLSQVVQAAWQQPKQGFARIPKEKRRGSRCLASTRLARKPAATLPAPPTAIPLPDQHQLLIVRRAVAQQLFHRPQLAGVGSVELLRRRCLQGQAQAEKMRDYALCHCVAGWLPNSTSK